MRRQLWIMMVIAGTAGAAALATAQAATYRWVNEQGVTVYSQTPPPSGQATVIPPPPPPATGAPIRPPIEEQLKQIEAQKAERQQREAKAADEKKRQTIMDANCRNARHNLEVLEGPARRRFAENGGEYQRLTEEERQKRIELAKENIKQFCSE